MSHWYRKVAADISNLPDCIAYFEGELIQARIELKITGSLEKAIREMPGVFEYRFSQLQEIEAILEQLNIEVRKLRSAKFRQFTEHYNRALTSRDAEKYVDGEPEVVNMDSIVNEFALVRNKFIGITKALDSKQFQVSNVTRLRVAGMEDAELR
jgi:hypothetical protein